MSYSLLPSVRPGYGLPKAAFLSLDIAADSVSKGSINGALSLPSSFLVRSTSVVSFAHPLRLGSVRLMCVLRSPPQSPNGQICSKQCELCKEGRCIQDMLIRVR